MKCEAAIMREYTLRVAFLQGVTGCGDRQERYRRGRGSESAGISRNTWISVHGLDLIQGKGAGEEPPYGQAG